MHSIEEDWALYHVVVVVVGVVVVFLVYKHSLQIPQKKIAKDMDRYVTKKIDKWLINIWKGVQIY